MKIGIDDKDLKELEKTLKKIIKVAPEDADQLFKETTAHIQGQAKQLAPVNTGWLRKNLTKGKDQEGYFVSSNADYSVWVEYGNRWWTGVSFFRPAIENGLRYMEEQVKKRFNY